MEHNTLEVLTMGDILLVAQNVAPIYNCYAPSKGSASLLQSFGKVSIFILQAFSKFSFRL